jgi:hypothetical protein
LAIINSINRLDISPQIAYDLTKSLQLRQKSSFELLAIHLRHFSFFGGQRLMVHNSDKSTTQPTSKQRWVAPKLTKLSMNATAGGAQPCDVEDLFLDEFSAV